jgi:hypothetical protein
LEDDEDIDEDDEEADENPRAGEDQEDEPMEEN